MDWFVFECFERGGDVHVSEGRFAEHNPAVRWIKIGPVLVQGSSSLQTEDGCLLICYEKPQYLGLGNLAG